MRAEKYLRNSASSAGHHYLKDDTGRVIYFDFYDFGIVVS